MTQPTDRELLELAAKAAGYDYRIDECGDDYQVLVNGCLRNPRDDDGDALRLAVKLSISSCWHARSGCAVSISVPASGPVIRIEEFSTDPYAATRRAITRAAAEIGRNMK